MATRVNCGPVSLRHTVLSMGGPEERSHGQTPALLATTLIHIYYTELSKRHEAFRGSRKTNSSDAADNNKYRTGHINYGPVNIDENILESQGIKY